MNFDDRLKRQLENQGQQITIEPATVDSIAQRSQKRKQKRMAGMAVAVAAVLLGVGGMFLNQEGGSQAPVELAVDSTEAEQDTESSDPADDPQEADAVAPGAPLQFVNVETGESPGGFNIWNGTASIGDVYFALSTAPGSTFDEANGDFGRADTLYRFDEDGWSTTDFGDRYVTSFGSSTDGLLYTLSTGSPSSDVPSVGTSNDGGNTWQWTDLNLSAQFGDDPTSWPYYQAMVAARDGQTFVVISANQGPDWQEAIELAQAAGADIDPETDEIRNLTVDGISWIPDAYQVSPCQQAMQDFYEERGPDEADYEAIYDFEGEPSDEKIAEIEAFEREQERIWRETEAAANEFVQTVPGCETFGACNEEASARQQQIFEELEGPDGQLVPTTTTIPLSESSVVEAAEEVEFAEDVADAVEGDYEVTDAEFEAAYAEFEIWLDESGCREILGWAASDYEVDESNLQQATWADLGVAVPDHWYGSNAGYLVANGEVQNFGELFADEDGYLLEVTFTGNGFEAVFDGPWTEQNEIENTPPPQSVWSSADGVSWQNETQAARGYGSVNFKGASFAIDWQSESETSSLLRSDGSGSTRLSVEDLAPNLDLSEYSINGVQAGEYGIVAWAATWAEAPNDGYTVSSVVFFSPDGVTWGATELPDSDITSVLVGESSVMVFGSNPALANSENPQPVLLGRVG